MMGRSQVGVAMIGTIIVLLVGLLAKAMFGAGSDSKPKRRRSKK